MTTALTRNQVRRIDQLAIEEYGIPGLVLMENAGRGAAQIIDHHFGPSGTALIVCGTGNNGGDGFVIARHLCNNGWSIKLLIMGGEDRMTPDARANFRTAAKMGIASKCLDPPNIERDLSASALTETVVVDALLGTGFSGTVRDPTASLLAGINDVTKRAIVSIDIPSGLDCDTGVPGGVAIRANYTITFVARKTGFGSPSARSYLGTVHVVDIGAPAELINRVGQQV